MRSSHKQHPRIFCLEEARITPTSNFMDFPPVETVAVWVMTTDLYRMNAILMDLTNVSALRQFRKTSEEYHRAPQVSTCFAHHEAPLMAYISHY